MLLIPGFLGVLSSPASAQQGPSVRVVYAKSELTIAISRNVSLRVVLDEFCLRTNVRCEGTPQTEGLSVVPLSLHGTWQGVVSRLLDGTGLNYAFDPPSVKSPGRLIIQPRSPNPTENSAGAGQPVATPPALPSRVPDTVSAVAPETGADQYKDRDPGQTASAPSSYSTGGASAPVFSSTVQTATGVAGSPLTSDVAPSAEVPTVLPFPDSQGRPIPVSTAPEQYLPFPDSKGNPIPVKPEDGGSPFPVEAIRQAQKDR